MPPNFPTFLCQTFRLPMSLSATSIWIVPSSTVLVVLRATTDYRRHTSPMHTPSPPSTPPPPPPPSRGMQRFEKGLPSGRAIGKGTAATMPVLRLLKGGWAAGPDRVEPLVAASWCSQRGLAMDTSPSPSFVSFFPSLLSFTGLSGVTE